MVKLVDLNEENFFAYRALSVFNSQSGFLDTAPGIIARGYIYRDSRARVFGIEQEGAPAGLALIKDLDEEPACYDLQQFMVDSRFQGRGVGSAALRLILDMLETERKYPRVEVCVKKENAPALRMFLNAGFADSGYTDPSAPDSVDLVYTFTE